MLRKDFTVSENDVLDAADAGASAVLLIVAALSDGELRLVHRARRLSAGSTRSSRCTTPTRRDARWTAARESSGSISATCEPSRSIPNVRRMRSSRRCRSECLTRLRVGTVEREPTWSAPPSAGFDAVLVGEAFVTRPIPRAVVRSFSLVASVLRG